MKFGGVPMEIMMSQISVKKTWAGTEYWETGLQLLTEGDRFVIMKGDHEYASGITQHFLDLLVSSDFLKFENENHS